VRRRVTAGFWSLVLALVGTLCGESMAMEQVVVDPAAQYQTMEGWGTSLCWWATIVGGWEAHKREAVADLLFHPEKGLGLNVVRYNIGGGDAPGHKHHRPGGAVPGYKPTRDGPYDWATDANQRWMLQAALARGATLTEAFANSPPWWMTVSGCTSGAKNPKQGNLRADCHDAFAAYLADVAAHFRDAWGVTFRTIEPFNEPMADWWKAGKSQEGCRIELKDQVAVVKALHKALEARGLTTQISAMDCHSVGRVPWEWRAYDAEARALVAQLNTHGYSGGDTAVARCLASRDGKRLWMSEFDMGSNRKGGPGHDHEHMAPALDLAAAIVRDLRDLQPAAWVFWQAVENEQFCIWWKFNYGLLHANFTQGTEAWHVTKKYHAMAQFTRFVRPGFQMVGIGASDAVAFVHWRTGRLVIVAFHRGEGPRERHYDLSAFGAVGKAVAVHRTADGENRKRLPDLAATDEGFTATEAAHSITTYVLDGVSYDGPVKLNDTVQQGSNRFEFVGEWAFKGGEPRAFTRDNHWSARTDEHYLVRFRGTRIRLYAAQDPNHGIAAVSLDGGAETLVDLYAPQRRDQALIYSSPTLPRGDHVLRVRVTGRKHPQATHPVVPADRADIW